MGFKDYIYLVETTPYRRYTRKRLISKVLIMTSVAYQKYLFVGKIILLFVT